MNVFIFLYRTLKAAEVEDFCGDSYQCKYDYSVTLNKEYGHWTKYYQSQYISLKENELKTSKFAENAVMEKVSNV